MSHSHCQRHTGPATPQAMRGCHFRTRIYKPRASSLVRSQSHVLSGSSPWKRLSRVGRLCTVDQPASEVEGRYPRRGNVRMYGLCARKITAIEDEGMRARQCLGGVNCFGTRLRVCCLSAAAYCLGFVLSLSFTHLLTHCQTLEYPEVILDGTSSVLCQHLQRLKHSHLEAIYVLAPPFLLPPIGPFTVVTHVLIPSRVTEAKTLPGVHRIHTRIRTPSRYAPSSKSWHPQSQQQSSSSRSSIPQPPLPSRSATPATRSPRAPSSSSSSSARVCSSAWATPYTRPLDSEETLMSSDT